MNLQNVKMILNSFRGELINPQSLTNQYLSEDINRLTENYRSPDNMLTRVDVEGLFVKTV